MTRIQAMPSLDAGSYQRHMLHAEERLWVEKNCYVDLCIELLHALRVEPRAALGFCAAVDFEGDHFTFFKPSHDEMRDLYGIEFQELNVWRPLIEHAARQMEMGRLIATEADAFFLPDTAGTDYRRNHVKTSIILADLDADQRRLGYFHSAGYFALEGDDFDSLFRLGAAPDPTRLPLFAEVIRVDRLLRRSNAELALLSLALLTRHVERRPISNPIVRFQQAFERDLPAIRQRGLEAYHMWAFDTLRQLGAASELLALHLQWLVESGQDEGLAPAAGQFEHLSSAAKAFVLKAARSVNTKKQFDGSTAFDEMSQAWESGMQIMTMRLQSSGYEVRG